MASLSPGSTLKLDVIDGVNTPELFRKGFLRRGPAFFLSLTFHNSLLAMVCARKRSNHGLPFSWFFDRYLLLFHLFSVIAGNIL